MQKLRSKIIVLILISVLCTQCGLFKKQAETTSIQRFEIDFFNTDTTDFQAGIEQLIIDYPYFFPVFVEGVLNITSNYRNVDSYVPMLYEFRTHPSMIGLRDSIQFHFPKMDSYEHLFTEGLQQYKKHFPEQATPEVVTFVSEFGNKAILYDGGIGISMDMFLGEQYPYYRGIGLPEYMVAHLNGDQILPNAMRMLAEDHINEPFPGSSMLDIIVYEGKKLYFAHQMIKNIPAYRIIEFNEAEYNWCVANEANIWSHLIDTDILFSQKYTEYNRFIDPSPTTYGMPTESPGRTGIWMGWQIVNAYMAKRSGTTLRTLMQDLDARTILEEANYRPR